MLDRGFALPTIIMTSLALFIIGFAVLQSVMSLRESGLSNYYYKIAEEAAEAGVTYASSCLENNQRNQTWGPTDSDGNSRPTLKQNTTCDGSTTSGVTSVLVVDDNSIKTEFEVGNLDFSLENTTQVSGVQISAKGYAKVESGSGVSKTYEATIKKTITWAQNLVGEQSVSGTYRTCAVLSGDAYCWGRNKVGQLGNGQYEGGWPESSSSLDTNIPVKVKKETGVLTGKSITDIFAANYHNCALTEGKVYCWGFNYYGQLGDGTRNDSAVPVEVGGALSGKTVTSIGGSGHTTCAIAENKIYCWGYNYYGSAGVDSSTSYYTSPQLVSAPGTSTTLPTNYTATKISTSGTRSWNMCAIADDQAYCWGPNDEGAVGDNTTTDRRLPTKVYQESGVLLGKNIVQISQDGNTSGSITHTCVLATDTSGGNGKAYCWGENDRGQVGIGSSTDSYKPVAVAASGSDALAGKVVSNIATGMSHTCAVADGEAYCWGYNNNGQIGDNTTTIVRNKPVAVAKLSGGLLGRSLIQIGGGANRSCGVTSDGKTFCWGRNSEGQIGDGTLINRYAPTESLFLRPKNNEYIY